MSKHETHTIEKGFGLGHLLLAFLAGAAGGAVAAYLTAPRSGAATRRRLHAFSDDVKDAAVGTRATAERLGGAFKKASEAARVAFQQALIEAENQEDS